MIVYRELSSLERDLGVDARTLYAVSNSLSRHYRPVRLAKKDGGYRTLSVPDPVLKDIQRRIARVLLAYMPVSWYACAYRFGGSTMANAGPHVGKPTVLKLDILQFFDSIGYTQVKDSAFPPEIYAEPLRVLLAMLCYRDDALPQGAPSSPAITNILLYPFDEAVGSWCREKNIAYTRYCDDMTFSGDFDPAQVLRLVGPELRRRGFLLNGQKTRIQHSGQRQMVTGILVNEKLNTPRDYRRALRQELYCCRKFGVREHLEKTGQDTPEGDCLRGLLGRVSYVLRLSPEDRTFLEARDWLREALRQWELENKHWEDPS